MDVIAFELASEDLPFIPRFVILRRGDGLHTLAFRDAREDVLLPDLHEMVVRGKAAMLGVPEPWREGSWPAVEADGLLRWFFLSDEKRWREARARALLQEARAVMEDPVRKLSLLAAAGNMGDVDVPRLVTSLEARRRSPSESLFDIYRRLERERASAGGQPA